MQPYPPPEEKNGMKDIRKADQNRIRWRHTFSKVFSFGDLVRLNEG